MQNLNMIRNQENYLTEGIKEQKLYKGSKHSSCRRVLLYYLPISWKKYLNINEFGSPVLINLNNTKIIPPSFNLIDETVYDLNYEFSWKENGIKHTGKAKGYVGLRFDSMSMSTQGINLYRRGQLIKPFEHSLYMAKGVAKHNDFNYLVGELDVELSATTTKTGFNVDSPGWKHLLLHQKKNSNLL